MHDRNGTPLAIGDAVYVILSGYTTPLLDAEILGPHSDPQCARIAYSPYNSQAPRDDWSHGMEYLCNLERKHPALSEVAQILLGGGA